MANPFEQRKKSLKEALDWGEMKTKDAVDKEVNPLEPTYQPKKRSLEEPATTTSTTSTSSTSSTTRPEDPNRKEYGLNYGDQASARDYLGHFASEDVMKKGHNVGYKKIGKAKGDDAVSKKGYRVIPGSASPQVGVADAFIHEGIADTGLKLKPFEEKINADNKKWIKKLSKFVSEA